MNLLVKSLGLMAILAIALFFFSCEDETSLLGFKNPNTKFGVSYIEIPLTSSVLGIDSIYTDNFGLATQTTLVGRYTDPLLGQVTAKSFLQLYPSSGTLIAATAVYDSVTVNLRLNSYAYGLGMNRTEKFTIHELADTISRFSHVRYDHKKSIPYNAFAVDEVAVALNAEDRKKNYALGAAQQDTVVVSARLSDAMGQELFSLSQDYDFDNRNELQTFITQVKGLALVPSESEAVIGIRTSDALSSVKLHYHTVENGAVKDTLVRSFVFNSSSFTNIETERGSSELAGIVQSYQGIEPASGLRVVQNGTPVITKLNLENFYAFADTVENAIINSAEFFIDGVESSTAFAAHSSLGLRVMKNNGVDQFANYKVDTDSVGLGPFGQSVQPLDNVYFYVTSDLSPSNPTTLTYSTEKKQLSGFATLFAQRLFLNSKKTNVERLQYLGIIPLTPSPGYSVTRSVFNADNIKLRIYYTRPSQVNP